MTGPHPSKRELEGANVYGHEQDPESGAQVTHIDVEHPDINEIIESGENTYVGGKEGGVFIGLDDETLDRAAASLEARRAEEDGEGGVEAEEAARTEGTDGAEEATATEEADEPQTGEADR